MHTTETDQCPDHSDGHHRYGPSGECMGATCKAQSILHPCRSPYCECEPGECTRPGFRDARHEVIESADEENRLRALFEATAKDSFNFRRSRRGTYVNPAIARDWKWFYIGATKGNKSHSLRPAEIERIVYEHTKLNPNQADDVELLTYIRKAVRAILALRPQSESEQEKELRRSLAEAQATISERNAEIVELQKRIHRSPQAVPMTDAARDVLAERQRQISTEGWTPEHDDEHSRGEMARAAASYALDAASQMSEHPGVSRSLASSAIGVWPWSLEWHKPTNERRDLIKAGALILAEIERLDRASGITAPAGGEG